jgi:iron complex transport system substrate-binding protein
MRIVSLLPSLTELVCALSRGADLVGVTHECDYPPGVDTRCDLTRSRITTAAASSEINALVSQQEGSLYELDEAMLVALEPDLILTQEQCDVCAVNFATVRRTAARLPHAIVESVNPTTLGEVLTMFRRIAALLGGPEQAESLVSRVLATAAEIAHRLSAEHGASPSGRPGVVLLEWLDPPYCSGHWNPELIERAGGIELLGRAGHKSRALNWEEIVSSNPDVVLVAPCGYSLARAAADLEATQDRPEWRNLAAVRAGRVVVVDGSAYFSRPGPRLETSLRIAAAAIHPGTCRDLAPPEGEGWRFWAGAG